MTTTTPTHLLKRGDDTNTPAPQPFYSAPKKGRPKLDPQQKKDRRTTVLLTQDQQKILDHAVKAIGFASRSRMVEFVLVKYVEHVAALDAEVRRSFFEKRFKTLAKEFHENMGRIPPEGHLLRASLKAMDAENISEIVRDEYDTFSKREDVVKELMSLGVTRTLEAAARESIKDPIPNLPSITDNIAQPMPVQ